MRRKIGNLEWGGVGLEERIGQREWKSASSMGVAKGIGVGIALKWRIQCSCCVGGYPRRI